MALTCSCSRTFSAGLKTFDECNVIMIAKFDGPQLQSCPIMIFNIINDIKTMILIFNYKKKEFLRYAPEVECVEVAVRIAGSWISEVHVIQTLGGKADNVCLHILVFRQLCFTLRHASIPLNTTVLKSHHTILVTQQKVTEQKMTLLLTLSLPLNCLCPHCPTQTHTIFLLDKKRLGQS